MPTHLPANAPYRGNVNCLVQRYEENKDGKIVLGKEQHMVLTHRQINAQGKLTTPLRQRMKIRIIGLNANKAAYEQAVANLARFEEDRNAKLRQRELETQAEVKVSRAAHRQERKRRNQPIYLPEVEPVQKPAVEHTKKRAAKPSVKKAAAKAKAAKKGARK